MYETDVLNQAGEGLTDQVLPSLPLDQVKRRLLEMDRSFDGLDQITEAAFLDLGAQVQKFHLRAREITSGVSSALSLLDGESCGQAVARLQLLVERCSLWLNDAQQDTGTISEALNQLEQRLAQLIIPLNGLRKVSKTLQALRVTTRIEASKSNGRGAEVMSQELGQLIGMVQDKTLQIDEQIDQLGKLCRQAVSSGDRAQGTLLRQANRELQVARQSLSLSVDQRLRTSTQTEKLKKRSEEITFSFGEIIAALQFQDITRQRLEHIQQALKDLATRIESREAENHAAGLVRNVCELQSEQLELSINEFKDAAQRLVANLETMAGASVNLVTEASDSDFDAGLLDQSEKIAPVLRAITKWLEDIWAVHQTAEEAISQVCLAVRSMTELIDEIEFIGEEMQLLAMNAAVNAAHTQVEGGGLEVIADNIHDISETASQLAVTLATECLEIASQADSIDSSEAQVEEQGQPLDALIEESRALLTSIQSGQGDLNALLDSVRKKSIVFADDVAYMVRSIDIQERFLQQVMPLLGDMKSLVEETARYALTDDDGDVIDSLSSKYTMMSERQIHQGFIDRRNQGGETADRDEESADETVGSIDHDLGDNVELF